MERFNKYYVFKGSLMRFDEDKDQLKPLPVDFQDDKSPLCEVCETKQSTHIASKVNHEHYLCTECSIIWKQSMSVVPYHLYFCEPFEIVRLIDKKIVSNVESFTFEEAYSLFDEHHTQYHTKTYSFLKQPIVWIMKINGCFSCYHRIQTKSITITEFSKLYFNKKNLDSFHSDWSNGFVWVFVYGSKGKFIFSFPYKR